MQWFVGGSIQLRKLDTLRCVLLFQQILLARVENATLFRVVIDSAKYASAYTYSYRLP